MGDDGSDDGADEVAASRRRRLPGLPVLPVVLGVLLVVLLASSLLLLHDRDGEDPATPRPADLARSAVAAGLEDDGVAGEAVLVARRAATAYFTLDHRRLDADVARFDRLLTDGFAERADTVLARLRRDVLRRRLVVTPELPADGTATEYLSSTSATVLVSVDAVTSVRGRAEPSLSYRTRVTLTRVDDRWQVSDLERVG